MIELPDKLVEGFCEAAEKVVSEGRRGNAFSGPSKPRKEDLGVLHEVVVDVLHRYKEQMEARPPRKTKSRRKGMKRENEKR